jgi:hypothetical protein
MFDRSELLVFGGLLVFIAVLIASLTVSENRQNECKQSAITTLTGADLVSALSACDR